MANNQYSTNIIAHPYSKERCERKVNKRRKRNWNRLEKKSIWSLDKHRTEKEKRKRQREKRKRWQKAVPLPGDCWRAPRRGQRGLMSQAGGHLLSTTTTIQPHTDTQSHDQTINMKTDQTFKQPYKHKQQVHTTHTPRVQPGNARGYERQRNEKEQEKEAVSSCWIYSSGHSIELRRSTDHANLTQT